MNEINIQKEMVQEVLNIVEVNLLPDIIKELNEEVVGGLLKDENIRSEMKKRVKTFEQVMTQKEKDVVNLQKHAEDIVKENTVAVADLKIKAGKELKDVNLQIEELNKTLQDIKKGTPLKIETPKGEILELGDLVHDEFETLLQLVVNKVPTYLVGPAGTGKNHAVEQIAKVLDLKFYFTNAVTEEFKLTGYGNAEGDYIKTPLYEAMINGGIFFFDEIDASVPEALIVINACLANGYFDFPVVGRVTAHKDFRVIAAGNTNGAGAVGNFTARNKIDSATLDRFLILEWKHDKALENKILDNIIISYELTDEKRINVKSFKLKLKTLRAEIDKAGVSTSVSIRNMLYAIKLACTTDLSDEKIIELIMKKYSLNELEKIKQVVKVIEI